MSGEGQLRTFVPLGAVPSSTHTAWRFRTTLSAVHTVAPITAPAIPATRNPHCQPLASIMAPMSGAARAVPPLRHDPCHPMMVPRESAGTRSVSASMEDVIVGAQNTPPTNSRMAVDAGPRDKAGKAVSVPRKTRRSAVDAPRGKAPYSVPPMADPNPDAASTQPIISGWPMDLISATAVNSRPPRQNPVATTAKRMDADRGDSHAILRLCGAGTIGAAEAGVQAGQGCPQKALLLRD